jgi:16S rRNA processing protein RimM
MTDQGHQRIPAGYVRRAHGIGGDVVVRGTLKDAAERFVVGAVFATNEDLPREFTIEGVRPHQGDYIVGFAEVSDRNGADGLRGTQFMIDIADRRQLEDREWWPEDLKGCEVVSVDGDVIGSVIDVITGASQDRLVVKTVDGVTGEVPFVADLVPDVDVERQTIVVDLPSGLLDS